MKIDREQWTRLSALLDAALEVDPSERDAWLRGLTGDARALEEPLRTLLAQRARIETDDFMKAPDFAAVLRSESARLQDASLPLEAQTAVGAYRLLHEVGRGGMASVWLAERIDGKLKRQVALKFPYAGPNQRQLAERLARERDILASLEHPNIARLYDADIAPSGQPFLVLEYVDGSPIGDYSDQHCLSIRDRLVLFLQVLSAVQYAHTRLVIHRDLKPSNILVRKDGVAQLLDFGVAKLIADGEPRESAVTQFGGRALTPDYASPEQITGGLVTTACDVYSLGVVLYELLTGNRPYRLKRDSRGSLEDAIAEADVIVPSRVTLETEVAAKRSTTVHQLARQLRGDLDTIVLKALRKDPAERYASVEAFMRDVESSLDNKPVDARPHSRLYLFRKLIARNRLVFGAAATVMLMLIVAVGATTWQAARARESERRALAAADTSEAIKEFMIRIFQTNTLGQPDPAAARQKTALELLEAGANRIGVRFKNDPALHRELLGIVLRLLGESRSADYEKHAIEFIDVLKGFPGSETQQAEIYNELSITKQGTDVDASVRYAQAGLTVLDAKRTASDPASRKQRAMLLTSYATALNRRGHFADGQEPLLKARELMAAEFPHTAEYGHVLSELGWIELRQDRTATAIDYFEQAMRAYESDPTTYQRTIAQGRGDLSAGYSRRKQYALAERELRLAAAGFHKSYGPADPETALATARLAKAIALQNRYEESYALLRPAIQVLEQRSANFNANYLLAGMEYLADAFVRAGQLNDAAAAVSRVLEFSATQPPISQINSLIIAAEYDSMRGRYARAEDSSRRAVELATEVFGESNVRVAKTNNELGRLLINGGKLDEADALFDANLRADAANAALFDSAWTAASVQHARVLIERAQGREAVPLLSAAMEKYLAQPADQRDLNEEAELRLALGRALVATDRAALALPHLERALALRQTQFAFSPRLAQALGALADCKLRLGDLEAAQTLLGQAQAILAKNPEIGAHYRRPIHELSLRVRSAEQARTAA